MKVEKAMSRDVRVATPGQTIAEAAQIMAEIDSGILPVGTDDQLIGMITDRDIAIRGVAKGCGPDTKVHEVMTADVKYCFEDEDIAHIAKNMSDLQVRRLPVLDRQKRLVGILSLADIVSEDKNSAVKALHGISAEGGMHGQSMAGGR